MLRRSVVRRSWVLILLASGSAVMAQPAYQVLLSMNQMHVPDPAVWVTPYTGAFCFEGNTAYCIIRGKISEEEWGSQITKVENIDSAPTKSLLVSNATWKAFVGGDEWETIGAPNRMAIIGDYLQYLDASQDAVYRVHKTTGALSLFVSNAAIRVHTGLAEAKMWEEVAFSPHMDMAFYDEISDSVIVVDVNGNLSTLISDAQFRALYGYKPTSHVSGGISYDVRGRFYWSLTQWGNTGPAGGAIYKRDCDGTLSRLLWEQNVWDVTFSYGNVAFNDIFVATDGNMYFYERGDSDSILRFDPDDPNLPWDDPVNPLPDGVLFEYLTKAQLLAGPAGAYYVGSFDVLGPSLVWHNPFYLSLGDLYTKGLVGLPKSRADFDRDDVVALSDLEVFEACATGPGIAYDPGSLPGDCQVQPSCGGIIPPDFDEDGDVDVRDFAVFQRCYSDPADPDCVR